MQQSAADDSHADFTANIISGVKSRGERMTIINKINANNFLEALYCMIRSNDLRMRPIPSVDGTADRAAVKS